MARFSDEEVRRYSRQIVLREVGGVGQERFRRARLDARSEVEALYLAAAGVGALTVPSEAIAQAVAALNPLVKVEVAAAPPRAAAHVNASLNSDDVGPAAVEAGALAALGQLKRLLAEP